MVCCAVDSRAHRCSLGAMALAVLAIVLLLKRDRLVTVAIVSAVAGALQWPASPWSRVLCWWRLTRRRIER